MKNRILLENHSLPSALGAEIETFVQHHNHRRYRENLNNLTPADVYFADGPDAPVISAPIGLKSFDDGHPK